MYGITDKKITHIIFLRNIHVAHATMDGAAWAQKE